MASSGSTPISLYYSTTASTAPLAGNLTNGELAMNITDGKLFYKDNNGVVQTIAYKNTPLSTVTGTLPVANGGTNGTATPTSGAVAYGTGTAYAFTSAGTSGQVLTSNGSSAPTWSTPAGMTYPGAGIANSTGSAWGTSYTTTGSGTVVALATSPTFTTPVLGTPTSGNLNSCTADGTNAVGYRNVPQSGSAKTTSYSLVTGDVGAFIQVGSGGAIVIPNSTFAAGDVVSVFNNTSGSITITCNTTTAYISGTDATKASVSLATRGIATILFISGTVCVITGNVS
jgi:hypothetical protein